MNELTATFEPAAKTKFLTSHLKEKAGLYHEYSALVPCDYYPDRMRTVVTLRLYWPSSTCYAALWVDFKEAVKAPVEGGSIYDTQGTGSAGGGGYCKASAAADEAIRNAGFTLSSSIHGAGTRAIEEAVIAIARSAGWTDARLHVAHA